MSGQHEYSVKGHQKYKIIFYIAISSNILANVIVQFLNVVQYKFNIILGVSISTSIVFTVLYNLFAKFLWKIKLFNKLCNFPNLNGKYDVKAKSLVNRTGNEIEWSGTLGITQDWDKILITLVTSKSTSESISSNAYIEYIPNIGYKLYYRYQNNPQATESKLQTHTGYCTITFSPNINVANAEYYTNERASKGTMKLTKEVKNA